MIDESMADDQAAGQAHSPNGCADPDCHQFFVDEVEWLDQVPIEVGWHSVEHVGENTCFHRVLCLVRAEVVDRRHDDAVEWLVPITARDVGASLRARLENAAVRREEIVYLGTDDEEVAERLAAVRGGCVVCGELLEEWDTIETKRAPGGLIISRLCFRCGRVREDEVRQRQWRERGWQ